MIILTRTASLSILITLAVLCIGCASTDRVAANATSVESEARPGANYDVAANWGNWQYIAGVGADPRGGRHFGIEKQARQFDADGLCCQLVYFAGSAR